MVPDGVSVAGNFSDITFIQIDKAIGYLSQRQLIRGQKIFTKPQTQYQRATAAGTNYAIGLVSVNYRQAIGTFQAGNRRLDRGQQIMPLLHQMINQVGNRFGIRFRYKLITLTAQFLAQGFVVFNNAVVHNRQFGARKVGVRVQFCGFAVGGPASVSNAGVTGLFRR